MLDSSFTQTQRYIQKCTADYRLPNRDTMKAVAAFVLCCLALSVSQAALTCKEGPRMYKAQQIDAGQGQVVVRDSRYYGYYLIGRGWYRMTTARFRHVTVGPAGLWAIGINYKVYKYVAGYFRTSPGPKMRMVDAGGNDELVGISASYYGFCLRNIYAEIYRGRGNQRWNNLRRRLRYYSCSPRNGCWGVDLSFRVFYTQRLTPRNCGTAGWRYVRGLTLKVIEVGTDGRTFGVTRQGRVYERIGISRRYPFGTGWRLVQLCMPVKDVSYDLANLWIVTTSGMVMYCS